MVYYKLVKITFNAPEFAKVIIDMVVCHHRLPDLIVTNKSSFSTSKLWSSLWYFLEIKRKLSNAFYPQTDSQIEQQNSTIKAYLRVFVNFKHNN